MQRTEEIKAEPIAIAICQVPVVEKTNRKGWSRSSLAALHHSMLVSKKETDIFLSCPIKCVRMQVFYLSAYPLQSVEQSLETFLFELYGTSLVWVVLDDLTVTDADDDYT